MDDILISYSRRDKGFVSRLKTALEATGHSTWIDLEDIEPSETWWERIQAGIDAAEVVVFVASPNSLKSKVCHRELAHALACHKRVIPLMRQEVDETALFDHWERQDWQAVARENYTCLNSLQRIDFRKKPGFDCQYDEVTREILNPECDGELSDADSFKTSFATLLRAIEVDPTRRRYHADLLVAAKRWQGSQNDRSLLLRDSELRKAAHWLEFDSDKEPTPTDEQRAYIAASAQEEQRLRRRRQTVWLSFAILTVVLVALGIIAYLTEQARFQEEQLKNIIHSINTHTNGTEQFRLGEFATAQALYAEALDTLEDNPGLADHPMFTELGLNLQTWYRDLGVACLHTRDYVCAEENLQEAQRQDSNDVFAYLNLAVLHRDRQPPDYAAIDDMLERAKEINAGNSFGEYQIARIQLSIAFGRGAWQEVIDSYTQPDNAARIDLLTKSGGTTPNLLAGYQLDILYYVAASYEEVGKTEEACPYWQDYIEISLRYPSTYRTLHEGERLLDAFRRISTSSCSFWSGAR